METIYLTCAAVGGTLIVCQFLLTALGLGGHHDVSGGHDFDSSHDLGSSGHDASGQHQADHEAEANYVLSLITFRTVAAALAFFGLAGLAAIRAQLEPPVPLVVAVAAGAIALFAVGWLMRFLSRLNIDGTIRIDQAVGSRGTVYLSIPGAKAGAGKVHVNQINRTIEYKAITSREQLPTGAKIVVVGIVSADTVEVAPAPELERTAHV
jgi:membrane protein implicated in regulation of membrane protease activity